MKSNDEMEFIIIRELSTPGKEHKRASIIGEPSPERNVEDDGADGTSRSEDYVSTCSFQLYMH